MESEQAGRSTVYPPHLRDRYRHRLTAPAVIAARGIGSTCVPSRLCDSYRHHLTATAAIACVWPLICHHKRDWLHFRSAAPARWLVPSLVVEPSARVQIPLAHHIFSHGYHSIPMAEYIWRRERDSNPRYP